MRTYYRCADCLEVCAIDGEHKPRNCDCSGALEYMGRVERDRLVKDELRCACDQRCTSAQGPKCNCQCGGVNHGSGKVVEVVVDAGAVPRLKPRWDLPARLRRVETYRAAINAAESRIDKLTGGALSAIRAGRYVADKSDWAAAVQMQRQLLHAKKLRVHKQRMTAILKIAADSPRSENIGPPPVAVGLLFA